MEEVLDLYTRAYDSDYPLVCFDECSKQLISETRTPDQRTSYDYAHQMKYLVDECFPQARKILVVQDHLNTHVKASIKLSQRVTPPTRLQNRT